MRTSRMLRLALVVLLAPACTDEEVSHDTTMTAASAATWTTLTLKDSGSTANGSVTANRGGIACSITAGKSGTALAGRCNGQVRARAMVFLTARPGIGATLDHWTGCTPASDNPLSCQVAPMQATTVTVTFASTPNEYTLTVSGGSDGDGKVTSSPAGIACVVTAGNAAATGCAYSFPTGTAVVLKAIPNTGSYLKAWAGSGCDTAGTGAGHGSGLCTVTMTRVSSVIVSFGKSGVEATKGAWGAPFTWPVVGIHASLLPNGKVLTFGRTGHSPAVWDPASPTAFVNTARPVDFFCSGHVLLPDGRLFVAGGHAGADNFGLKTTYYYDAASNSWTRGGDMANGRWYPTTTVLPNGEVLAISGGDTSGVMNITPEVWQTDGSWRTLSTAALNIAYYSFMFVGPDGRVFAAGPAKGTRFWTTAGTGSIAMGPGSNFGSRDYGSAVMYDAGKILMVGGNQSTPTATAEVIDLNAGTAARWRYTGSMAVGRRQINATLLADGTVLVTGGTNAPGFNSAPTDSRVLAAERWNPATEQWTSLARMSHPRVYHSAALLLPDGRVLSVGSGEPAAPGLSDDYTAEVYSPPYLYNPNGTLATRPVISTAPANVAYGQGFMVSTPTPSAITGITWIRLGSVTHAFNQNQRMNRLTFSVSGTSALLVNAPADGRAAPPGHYLLFLVNSAGVPSVAKIVHIG